MILRSPRLLIAAASVFVGLSEHDAGGAAFIEAMRRAVGDVSGGRWDAAIVYHWGFWSHFDQRTERSSWPLVRASTAHELATFALEQRVRREAPEEGDVFVQYSPVTRTFVRTGVVVQIRARGQLGKADYYDIVTVEGNSNERGDFGGPSVVRAERRLSPGKGDRFIRWTEIDAVGGADSIAGVA